MRVVQFSYKSGPVGARVGVLVFDQEEIIPSAALTSDQPNMVVDLSNRYGHMRAFLEAGHQAIAFALEQADEGARCAVSGVRLPEAGQDSVGSRPAAGADH